jgi:putative lipoic acid-binding regulatory protein
MTDQEFDRFKEKLLETMTFPSVYMFKLIVPSENRTIALVENLFGEDADIHTLQSGQGKYTSITAKQVVIHVDDVIEVYKKANNIKGVIFL